MNNKDMPIHKTPAKKKYNAGARSAVIKSANDEDNNGTAYHRIKQGGMKKRSEEKIF